MHFFHDSSVSPVVTKSYGAMLNIQRVAQRAKTRDGFHKSLCITLFTPPITFIMGASCLLALKKKLLFLEAPFSTNNNCNLHISPKFS